jgi:hypothetical protein
VSVSVKELPAKVTKFVKGSPDPVVDPTGSAEKFRSCTVARTPISGAKLPVLLLPMLNLPSSSPPSAGIDPMGGFPDAVPK